jgi:hypothetical protein
MGTKYSNTTGTHIDNSDANQINHDRKEPYEAYKW